MWCFKPQHEHRIHSAKLVRYVTVTVSRHALGKIHLSNIIPLSSDQPHHPIKECQRLDKIAIRNTTFTEYNHISFTASL
jgi:hypothetical protein